MLVLLEEVVRFALIFRCQRQQKPRRTLRRCVRVLTTDSNHALPIAPNLLARNFMVSAPNTV